MTENFSSIEAANMHLAAASDDGECRIIFLVQSSMFVNKDKITLLAGLIPKLYLLAKL